MKKDFTIDAIGTVFYYVRGFHRDALCVKSYDTSDPSRLSRSPRGLGRTWTPTFLLRLVGRTWTPTFLVGLVLVIKPASTPVSACIRPKARQINSLPVSYSGLESSDTRSAGRTWTPTVLLGRVLQPRHQSPRISNLRQLKSSACHD